MLAPENFNSGDKVKLYWDDGDYTFVVITNFISVIPPWIHTTNGQFRYDRVKRIVCARKFNTGEEDE